MFRIGVLAIALMALAGCGGSGNSGGGVTFYCDISNYSDMGQACWVWSTLSVPSGTNATNIWGNVCSANGGTSASSCTTNNAIGKCTFTVTNGGVSVNETLYYYASSGFTQADAQDSCNHFSGMGTPPTWTPLP